MAFHSNRGEALAQLVNFFLRVSALFSRASDNGLSDLTCFPLNHPRPAAATRLLMKTKLRIWTVFSTLWRTFRSFSRGSVTRSLVLRKEFADATR